MRKTLIHFLTFVFLTGLTQVGGVVYLLSLFISSKLHFRRLKTIGLFLAVYLITTFLVIPLVAPFFGRAALPIKGNLKPLNIGTCLLNRHYVIPKLKEQLISIAEKMNKKFEGTETNYLEANFPFYDGFPLFPHLSHNDGRKIDLAFYYKDSQTGDRSNSAPSFIGYGIYEGPVNGEINYPKICSDQGFWKYGILTYLVPKWSVEKLSVDSKRTRRLIRLLATDKITSRIFIEPHLKERWNLNRQDKIRFHGCHAVRHDDHIHIQVK
jgi:hypothetical protein